MDEKDLKVNIPTEKEADIEQETKQENKIGRAHV